MSERVVPTKPGWWWFNRRSWSCKQLAAVTAERDDLRRRLASAPVMWAVFSGEEHFPIKVCETRIEADEEADDWDAESDRTSVTRVRLVRDDQ